MIRAVTDSEPVGTLTENRHPVGAISAQFDGRLMFSAYRAIGRTPRKLDNVGVAKDDTVPRARFLTFRADDTEAGDIDRTAQWRRSKQAAQWLTLSVPISSWYAPNGELWREGTIVTLVAPSIYLDDGYDLLVRAVEFGHGADGPTASLTLVPPQVYTGEDIDEPWLA